MPTFIQRVRWHGGKVYRRLRATYISLAAPLKSEYAEINGVKLSFGPHLSAKMCQQIVDGTYESAEITLLSALLEDGDRVLEVGAGLGYLSTFCAKKLGSESVLAVEANPSLEIPIRSNFSLNRVSPELRICVLAERAGEVDFFVEKDFWSSSLHRRSPGAKRVSVTTQSAYDVVTEFRPSILVVDIEGGESSLFDQLELPGIRALVIEMHPHVIGIDEVNRVRRVIESKGFSRSAAGNRKNVELFMRTASAI